MIITEKTFKFDLVTPDRVVASGNVALALLQGVNGEFGVLPNHSSMLSEIYTGIVTIISNKGDYKKFFTSSGFADINEVSCSILVEEAIDLDTLSNDVLQAELTSLKEKANDLSLNEEDSRNLNEKIFIAETKIRAKSEKPNF